MSGTSAALPQLITIPDVDILAAGTWDLSSGRQTFTRSDLTDAIEASKCPAVGAPIIKLGHVDPRFDGEPSIGSLANLRLDSSGNKLRADLAGMPGWLAAISASAFPKRSVEGQYNFVCQIGHEHPFVLTGLALLGVTSPGVGVLNKLADVATLYGVDTGAQTAASARPWQITLDEGAPVVAITEEDVRRAYYASSIDPTWWISELQMSPTQLVVSAGDGKIYRVPFHIEGDGIEFDAAEELSDYAALAASRGTGPTVTYASAKDSRAVAKSDGDAEDKADGGKDDSTENNGWVMRGGKWVFDPDGGEDDDDSNPETDTDHDYWAADGTQLKAIPPNPANGGKGGKPMPPKPKAAADDKSKPYGDVPYADPGYLDADGKPAKDGNGVKRYPLDEKHVVAAWSYINQSKNAGQYSSTQLSAIKGKIAAAMKKFGHDVSKTAAAATGLDDNDPVYAGADAPPTMQGDDVSGNMDNEAMTHGAYSGTHTHVHAANGSQGSDESHKHSHSHSGDGNHAHTHAAGNNRNGGSDVEFTIEQESNLRNALGMADNDELTAESVTAGVTKLHSTKVAAAKGRYNPPAGVIAVEQEVWENLNRKVEAADKFRERTLRAERDEVIDGAIRAGKFSAARKGHWARLWDADPEGTREVLAGLQKNTVPVDDIGSGGGNLDDDQFDREFAGLYPPGTFKTGN
jgi:hypothetical protein